MLTAASGCSSSDESTEPDEQGEGGTGGQGGVGGGDLDEADHEALNSCVEQLTCPAAFAQRIEGGSPGGMNDMECVIEALRDRTPGRYQVELSDSWTNGSSSKRTTIVVTPSGAAEIAVYFRSSGSSLDSTWGEEDWLPAERCELVPASFFTDCLAAVQIDPMDPPDEGWECTYPYPDQIPPWFDGCVEQPPTCQ